MADTEFSFYKTIYSEGCPGCSRVEPQPTGLDVVLETKYFRVHQDYALPIPGMMVVEVKRHVKSVMEFTANESDEFVSVLIRTRKAMKEAGVIEANLVQEEKSSHFHAWWLPIYPWMKEATEGKMRNIQLIFDHAKESMTTEKHIEEVEEMTKRIKALFA